jgi:predicted metalloprotease with PDZ domain
MKLSCVRLVAVILLVLSGLAAAQNSNCPANGVAYEVSLKDHTAHVVHVTAYYKSSHTSEEFQLPVWNALYQVRDFSEYVSNVRFTDSADQTEQALKVEKSTWRVDGDGECITLAYDIYANNPGPFDAQLNDGHAFFNWAQILMYSVGARSAPVSVKLKDVPEGWFVRDGGIFGKYDPAKDPEHTAIAPNYDALVDAPIEIGKFDEYDFTEGGGNYHIVVDADPADAKAQQLSDTIDKIVRAETDWMQDRPFTDYTFIYHVRRGPAGGGMEHANSTAIDISAGRLADSPLSFASVTAHEFFHLWNVKRIRPESLEPVDYTKEQYTRALWFSEGVTSTVSEWMLVRAGLLDEQGFLQRLARQIGELEQRPAKRFQSVEESSLDAWLEKYPYYFSPNRSVNYYNKGQIVGVLLDLEMREHSNGQKCLRDLFQYMNTLYAKQGQPFPDSLGVETAAEAVAGGDFSGFFEKYVAGTAQIPYDDFFRQVGLQLKTENIRRPDPGFTLGRPVGKNVPTIGRIQPGGVAEKAGIQPGDTIEEFNGKPVQDVMSQIAAMQPGEIVRLKIRSATGAREVRLTLGVMESNVYALADLANVTEAMRARRAAWIRGEAEAAPGGADE